MINEDVRHIIEPELQAGEEIIWIGTPAMFPFSGVLLFHLVLSFICTLIGLAALFFTLVVSNENSSLWFAIMLLCVGLYNLTFNIRDFFGRPKEVYAITNLRCIIRETFLSRRVTSLSPNTLLTSTESRSAKVQTIRFDLSPYGLMKTFNKFERRDRFLCIAEPKSVEALIRGTSTAKVEN